MPLMFAANFEKLRRRPTGTWSDFKRNLLPLAVPEENIEPLASEDEWTAKSVEAAGQRLAVKAVSVLYSEKNRADEL